MRNFIKFYCATFILLCSSTVFAQTTISNPIYTSTTWNLSGSPYIIASNIVVFEGATLSIDPGVVVKFQDGITVDFRGKLVANGTATAPITFTSANANPTMGIYGGFKVTGYVSQIGALTNQLTFSYCNVSYASAFVDLAMSAQGPFTFTNCNFTNNGAVNNNSADYGDLIYDHCTFTGNYQGVVWNGGGDVYVNYCTFTNNTIGADAMYVSNSTFSGSSKYAVNAYQSLQHCEIFGNALGAIWDAHAATSMQYNYIHDNTVGVQISRFWNEAGIVFLYNKICHNSLWNLEYNFSFNADLTNNCWCSLDSAYIRSTIRDGYVNTQYGLVTYSFNDTTCLPGNSNNNSSSSNKGNTNTQLNATAFPNPFSNSSEILFNTSDISNCQLLIVNELGSTVRIYNNISGSSVVVDKNELPIGLYFYHLVKGSQTMASGKLLIH
jgi:hypothetical protein